MAESELYKKGTEIRRKLIGEAATEKMAQTVYDDPIMKKFGDYAREAVFGMLWTRPGLDLKTKALICVISDTAQARWPELAIHLRMARNTGPCRGRSARAADRSSSLSSCYFSCLISWNTSFAVSNASRTDGRPI